MNGALIVAVVLAACDPIEPTHPDASSELPEEVVQFSDSDLEETVRRELARARNSVDEAGNYVVPTGPLTPSDLEELTELTDQHVSSGITHLTGLEYATNLTKLSLPDHRIGDLTPLSGLSKLQHVDLGGNAIQDLKPLRELSDLHRLILRDNRILDPGPLSGLLDLEYLDLSGNQVEDATPLSGLANLRILLLNRNVLSDPIAIPVSVPIGVLGLAGNEISDLSEFRRATTLVYLDVGNNPLSETAICDDVAVIEANGVTVRGAPACPQSGHQPQPPVSLDQYVYVAEVSESEDVPWRVQFPMTLRYTNRTDASFWMDFCNGYHPPHIERLVDNAWEIAWTTAELTCGGPVEIRPDEAIERDLTVIGFDPAEPQRRPTWRPGVETIEGTYRIVWPRVRFGPDPDAEEIPLADRVSRPFTIMPVP